MDEVVKILKEIADKIDKTNKLLTDIASNTSGTESNTGDIYYVKSELEEVNTFLKTKLKK